MPEAANRDLVESGGGTMLDTGMVVVLPYSV